MGYNPSLAKLSLENQGVNNYIHVSRLNFIKQLRPKSGKRKFCESPGNRVFIGCQHKEIRSSNRAAIRGEKSTFLQDFWFIVPWQGKASISQSIKLYLIEDF